MESKNLVQKTINLSKAINASSFWDQQRNQQALETLSAQVGSGGGTGLRFLEGGNSRGKRGRKWRKQSWGLKKYKQNFEPGHFENFEHQQVVSVCVRGWRGLVGGTTQTILPTT